MLLLAAVAHAGDADPLTALATGAAAYLTTSFGHEVVGHGIGCAAAGSRPIGFSSIYMVCPEEGLGPGDLRFGVSAGPGVNLLLGTTFSSALLLSPPKDGWTYHYLWTSTATNLFIAGTYMFAGSAGEFGDFGIYLDTVKDDNRGLTQIGLMVAGAGVISAGFGLSTALAEPLLGSDPETRKRRWMLALVPYLGAGIGLMTSTSLLHQEGPGAATGALVGYGLGTLYLGALPLFIPGKPLKCSPKKALSLERSTPWLVTGAVSLAGLLVLGRGVGDLSSD